MNFVWFCIGALTLYFFYGFFMDIKAEKIAKKGIVKAVPIDDSIVFLRKSMREAKAKQKEAESVKPFTVNSYNRNIR